MRGSYIRFGTATVFDALPYGGITHQGDGQYNRSLGHLHLFDASSAPLCLVLDSARRRVMGPSLGSKEDVCRGAGIVLVCPLDWQAANRACSLPSCKLVCTGRICCDDAVLLMDWCSVHTRNVLMHGQKHLKDSYEVSGVRCSSLTAIAAFTPCTL